MRVAAQEESIHCCLTLTSQNKTKEKHPWLQVLQPPASLSGRFLRPTGQLHSETAQPHMAGDSRSVLVTLRVQKCPKQTKTCAEHAVLSTPYLLMSQTWPTPIHLRHCDRYLVVAEECQADRVQAGSPAQHTAGLWRRTPHSLRPA